MRATVITISAAEALTATKSGADVDVRAFHGLVEFILTSSATGGDGQTSTVTIEHSDDGSTGWTATGVAFDAVDHTGPSTQQVRAHVDQMKRYVRAVTTLGGETPTVTSAVLMAGARNYA